MSHTYRSTLLDLADTDAVTAYMKGVLNDHRDAGKKREVLTYLQRIVENDKQALKDYAQKHRKAVLFVKEHSARSELTDQSSISHILAGEQRSVDQLMQLLHVADGILFGVGYTFDNSQFSTPNDPFVIKGNNSRFLGESNGQSARENKLVCTCVVKAPLKFTPLDANGVSNVLIDGVKFIPQSEQATVQFTGKTFNLTFQNCIFDGENHASSRCFYGSGNHFEGTLTFTNCIFRNFKDWLLMDPSTSSGTPTTKMSAVTITQCLFKDNMGSCAFRNVQDAVAAGYSDNLSTFSLTDSVFDVSGLDDVHEYFWSSVECNNFSTVRVKNNVAEAFQKTDGTRGFFQCWSRGPQIDLQIEDNQLTNFNYAYQIALGDENNTATFQGCPANDGDLYYIKIGNDDLTNVAHPYSFVYPWNSTTAVVNLVSGFLPTVTLPNAQQPTNDIETDNITTLIEEYTWTNENDLKNHTFDLGTNTSGYIQINNTTQITAQYVQWFALTVHSDIIDEKPYKLWQDQIALPDGATWRVIEQDRSFASGTMTKRNMLDPGGSSPNVPANADYFFRLYFRIQ